MSIKTLLIAVNLTICNFVLTELALPQIKLHCTFRGGMDHIFLGSAHSLQFKSRSWSNVYFDQQRGAPLLTGWNTAFLLFYPFPLLLHLFWKCWLHFDANSVIDIKTMFKVNSNTIELTVHSSCYCILDLLGVVINLKYIKFFSYLCLYQNRMNQIVNCWYYFCGYQLVFREHVKRIQWRSEY